MTGDGCVGSFLPWLRLAADCGCLSGWQREEASGPCTEGTGVARTLAVWLGLNQAKDKGQSATKGSGRRPSPIGHEVRCGRQTRWADPLSRRPPADAGEGV